MSTARSIDTVKALTDAVALALRTQPLPLFAIIDGARSARALHLVKASKEEYASLYEGESATKLDHVAPYLVRFSRYSELLYALVQEGWGESWGIYLTCDREFAEVRKHLRHFLMVQLEGEGGKSVYFRFYDPRILRAYLPTCTAEEVREFIGPIGSFLLESENASQLLRFRVGGKAFEREAMSPEKGDVPHP